MKGDPQPAQVVLSQLEVATVTMVDSMEIERLATTYCDLLIL